jgi:hypothetical protein
MLQEKIQLSVYYDEYLNWQRGYYWELLKQSLTVTD